MLGDHQRTVDDFSTAIELAETEYGKNSRTFRNKIEAYFRLARATAYDRLRNFDAAKADCAEAIKLDPTAHTYQGCGDVYNRMGEYDRALAYYDEAARLQPNSADAYKGRASVLTNAEQNDQALIEANEAVKRAPEDPEAYTKRGWVFVGMKQFDNASADFSQAIRLNSRISYDAYVGRGVASTNKADYDHAVADFNSAISLAGYARGYFYRANAYRGRGDYERAEADYNEALRLLVEPRFVYERAVSELWQGKYDRAIADFSETLRLDPRYTLAYASRAEACLRAGRLDEALADAEAALKSGKRRDLAFAVRGQVLLARNRDTEAIDDFGDAIRLGDKLGDARPGTYAGRAAAYESQGRSTLAKLDYEKAVTLAADDPLQKAARLRAQERLVDLETKKNTSPLDSPKSLGRRVALVIGEGAYSHVNPLPNPANDARSMAEAFRQLGFAQVTPIIDQDRATILKAVLDFAKSAATADWAVVFYAGHGFQMDGRNYLVPVDAKLGSADELIADTINLEDIMSSAAEAKKLGLVILDACRSDPRSDTVRQSKASRGLTPSGLAKVEPLKGELVAFATRENHTADDGDDEHSPFTHALLYHINEPEVDVQFMLRKVRDTVLARTKNAQEPFTYGSLPGKNLYFKIAGD